MLQSLLLTLSVAVVSTTAHAVYNGPHFVRQVTGHPSTATTCAQDNCYRAYQHSTDIVSPFCSTYIRSTVTSTITPTVTVSGIVTITMPVATAATYPPITTNSQLSSRCNLDTVSNGGVATPLSRRLSSACSCFGIQPVIVTTTTTAAATTTTISSAPATCPMTPNPYTAPNGDRFALTCGSNGQNIAFGDFISYASGVTFQACVNSCSTTANCGVSTYFPATTECDLFQAGTLLHSTRSGPVDLAYLV